VKLIAEYLDIPPEFTIILSNRQPAPMSAGMADRFANWRRIRRLVPGITNRYCGPSFETAHGACHRARIRRDPLVASSEGCECISDLILRSLRSKTSRRMAHNAWTRGHPSRRAQGRVLRMRSNLLKHNNLMLRSERRERLEARAAKRVTTCATSRRSTRGLTLLATS